MTLPDTNRRNNQHPRIWIAVALLAIAFGLLTIKSGGDVLFGSEQARRSAGAYVGFVLWFNFLAGFTYVLAGLGLWGARRWAALLSFAIAAGTVLVFGAFAIHVWQGGAFEPRTVAAMSLRSAVWLGISALAYRWIWRQAD